MALVVFLRGVNVGGRRTFRPARLAAVDRIFGVPVTTRNWRTIATIGSVPRDGTEGPSRSAPQAPLT